MAFWLIARNAFAELLRQPASLIVLFGASSFIGLSANVYYFGFGDDARLVKNMVLALVFLAGLFYVVLGASSTLAREIRAGTALTVLAKPVGRFAFLLGKFTGLGLALAFALALLGLCALLASRMAFDVTGAPDRLAASLYFAAIAGALAYGAVANYLGNRPFVGDSSLALALLMSLVFLGVNSFDRHGQFQTWGQGIDWRLIPATVLLLMALLILGAIALACTTRLDVGPTLALCSGIFLLGLMSDYLLQNALAQNASWAQLARAALPNLQLFWVADGLTPGKTIPWSYVAQSGAYAACLLIGTLSLALLSFRGRELAG